MTDDNCPAPSSWFHGVAGSDLDALYPESDPGDVGRVMLERGGESFRVTVENVTGYSDTPARSPGDEESSLPSDLSVLQNKGALFILMAIGTADDGLKFTEVRDRTNLSNGTTQRRLKQLDEANWVRKEAELDDSGTAVTKYCLPEETEELWDSLRELGSTLLGS